MLQHSRVDKYDEHDDTEITPLAEDFQKMLRQGRSWSGLERNCVFLNTNGQERAEGKYANVSAVSGVDYPDDTRAIAHIDWDHDGDLDYWMSNRNAPRLRLIRNDANTNNRFVQIAVTGNGKDTNRNAVGARVTVTLKTNQDSDSGNQSTRTPSSISQTVYAGDAFLSQGTRWLQFGLGKDAEVENVSIRWPNEAGDVETFEGVTRNGRFELIQGTGIAKDAKIDRGELVVKPSAMKPAPRSDQHRIPLVFKLPVPEVQYKAFDGKQKTIQSGEGEAILVNLWSSSCDKCQKELKEFSERNDELKRAGVRVVATTIDQFDCDPNEDPVASSKATAERMGMPFDVGMADAQLLGKLQKLHNQLIVLETPLPLPTSFLIDKQGNLDVIYKGSVEIETVISDLKPAPEDMVARFERAGSFAGTVVKDPALLAPMALEGSIIHLGLGRDLMSSNRFEEAVVEYKKAIESAPHFPFAHNACGVALSSLGKIEEAIGCFQKAVDLDPSRVQFQVNLGQVMVLSGQHKQAEELLTKVVQEYQGHSAAWFQLGLAKLRQQKADEAKQDLQRAIECNPKHGQAHFTLGGLLLGQRNLDEARHHFETTLSIDPTQPVVLVNLAAVSLQQREMQDAEDFCQKAIALEPGYADAHFFMGLVYQATGRKTEARKSIETTLRYDPKHQRAIQALQRM